MAPKSPGSGTPEAQNRLRAEPVFGRARNRFVIIFDEIALTTGARRSGPGRKPWSGPRRNTSRSCSPTALGLAARLMVQPGLEEARLLDLARDGGVAGGNRRLGGRHHDRG